MTQRTPQYKVIAPLGPRPGSGTFDCVFNKKYKTREEAEAANDYVVINFVEDMKGVKYFELHHTKHPEKKLYQQLIIQHFPFGIDVVDDQTAVWLATQLLAEVEKEQL
jgi:hypothetical protein